MIGHKVRSSGLQNGTTCTPHPLSPLLFVLAADLLQSILNEAMHKNIVSVPIKINSCQDFPVIQYADDTVIIMPACQTQLNQIKNLLLHYSAYTGLRINYEKSIIVPINTPETKMIDPLPCTRNRPPTRGRRYPSVPYPKGVPMSVDGDAKVWSFFDAGWRSVWSALWRATLWWRWYFSLVVWAARSEVEGILAVAPP